jgi:chemotaxis protein methyltransferase CheR
MAFPELRSSDLEWAIERAAADSDASIGALYELLAGPAPSPAALDALTCALNVSETYFFRDAPQIHALEHRILPELIRRRRTERQLRVWSAGCSTGEEPYTLAILLKRLLKDLAEWDVLILATDINGRSLETARRGVYGAWSFRGTPPVGLISYVTPRGKKFEVVPSIRAMVTFAQLNLVDDIYPALATNTLEIDVVLCRNVLLYFDEEGGRAVVRRLRDALSDGGRLLVSQVEAGLRVFDGLEQDAPGTAVYRKVGAKPMTLDVEQEALAAVRPDAKPSRPVSTSRLRRNPPPLRVDHAGPGEAPATNDEALRLWRAGLAESALQRLETDIESYPLAAPLHYLYGLILIDANRSDEALVAFRRCTYADPKFALGHLAQAHLLARMGLWSRAKAPLETSARLVADLEADAVVLQGDGLSVGDVLELIAAERELLAAADTGDASRG